VECISEWLLSTTRPHVSQYVYLHYMDMKPVEVLNAAKNRLEILCTTVDYGARGGVVVKALRYKPAGRGFDSRW
jgi:hypothetical protein